MKDKLAIIVPYRDRQAHLDVFIPHMNRFLLDKGIDYTIFVAEQADDRPFNYGKLCNVVVNEIPKEYESQKKIKLERDKPKKSIKLESMRK